MKRCARCAGEQHDDAHMCQWCGWVDPDSPLGQTETKTRRRRELLIAAAVAVVLAVIVGLLVSSSLERSKDNARDDTCEFLRDEGIADLSGDC